MSSVRATGGILKRELGVFGAVMMGLGSILGTGIFVSLGIAAGVAGPSVVIAIILAAMVAACNALSSAQLAAAHPVSGGTYEYGYRYLRPSLGFTAGWLFLLAKSASAATAALGFSGYVYSMFGAGRPASAWAACAVVLVFTAVVWSGIRRSSRINIAVVAMVLLALLAFAGAGGWAQISDGTWTHWRPFFRGEGLAGSMSTLFHASALMFVAYTGYGRIATLAEEVIDPRRTIPRAIVATLAISAVIYLTVAAAGIGAVGADFLFQATEGDAAPLEAAAREFGSPILASFIAIGAAAAMLGVLLNLLLGLSRVVLAMGRRGDMPHALARLDRSGTNPRAAVLASGVLIAGLTLIGSVQITWSFSAFTVLLYYAITNASALALPKSERLVPRWIPMAGLTACLFLAFWVEWQIWLTGLLVTAAGLGWYRIAGYSRDRAGATP